MSFVSIARSDSIATLTLCRGKVNALNTDVVHELRDALATLEIDNRVRALILTGRESFFSFGFDIPEWIHAERAAFVRFVEEFTALYAYLFTFRKPVIAAINGHAIAGGCMLALACDQRVMVRGKARIALNEIGFGSSVFAGSTEMLRFAAGSANAQRVLYSGALFAADEAKELGLIDVATDDVVAASHDAAVTLSSRAPGAFAGIKRLLRGPVSDLMRLREPDSIREFIDIWYSEGTWTNLQSITIR